MYKVRNSENREILSERKGVLGGHKGLKIYGRLDCPSALNHLSKGKYAKHRVFFLSESDAVSAGYRPCAKCEPQKYAAWKRSEDV